MFEDNTLTLQLSYILTVVVSLAVTVMLYLKRLLVSSQYRRLSAVSIYLTFLMMMAVDLVWSISEWTHHQVAALSFTMNALCYLFFIASVAIWYVICRIRLGLGRWRWPERVAFLVPGLAVVVLLTVSWWTGTVIRTTSNGCYSRGPYLWLLYLACFCYGMGAFVRCVVHALRARSQITRRYTFGLALVSVPLLFCAYLQFTTGFAFVYIGIIVSIAMYDIDDQRRIADLTVAAGEARDQAFLMVSHDIRTPLNAIIGFSELLQKNSALDAAERQEMLSGILTSGKTLLRLVNDVLDYSKLEAGKKEVFPEPTNLESLVRDVLGVFSDRAADKSLRLTADLQTPVWLLLDPQIIRQVLFNLVGNALKFTERGGITVRGRYEEGVLTLAVADTGCGISAEDQKKVMSPFVQVGDRRGKKLGTGLGLSICKCLADLMKGTFSLASEPGKGSCFTLAFPCPVSAPPVRPARADTARARTVDSALRILIVDDELLNLKVLKAMLNRLGVSRIEMADNGAKALAALRAKPDAYDLVLTDLQMPEMDGVDLVRAVRADVRLARLPVYLISADVQARLMGSESGFSGILVKPVVAEKLRELLASLSVAAK